MELHLDCIASRTSAKHLVALHGWRHEKLEKTGRLCEGQNAKQRIDFSQTFISYHRGDATETDENLFRLAFRPNEKSLKEKVALGDFATN